MEATMPAPSTLTHYSSAVMGSIISASVILVILVIACVHTYCRGGPAQILYSFREQRKAKANAQDLEKAEAAENAERIMKQAKVEKRQETVQRQMASELVESLYHADRLVGYAPSSRPQQVNFVEERQLENDVRNWREVRRPNDSLDLAIDPMSYTWDCGKSMDDMYRE